MRKEIYRMSRDEALALLARAPVVHLATTNGAGEPILRTVHAVVSGGALAFHGAPAGEKLEALGRAAVLSAEEVVAPIPSYFVDPERACPATTFYRSAQVHGVLEPVEDAEEKARVLAALMAKLQPEGGHVPVDATHPLYRKAVAGLLIVRVSLECVDGKAKLGQNRRPEELAVIFERLWARGLPGDARAIEAVRAANPTAPTPHFLAAPPGVRLDCALGPDDVAAAVELLRPAYWNAGVSLEVMARAQLGASAWVGARDEGGRLVATARAVSDGVKWAAVFDVAVAPDWQGRGIGQAVVRLLLDHPSVRGARRVWLATRDAQSFYARFGFVDGTLQPRRSYPTYEMVLERAL
jgi:nitroimidazol reductase NimA-like FMN-containing flavoprotein (pyridoxamine 5'-phosphate oxidase superfamily)/ribosomal protein S18 acetylase RimI-like enzyme